MGLDKVKKTACGFCFVEYPSAGPARLPRGRWSPGGGAGPELGRRLGVLPVGRRRGGQERSGRGRTDMQALSHGKVTRG